MKERLQNLSVQRYVEIFESYFRRAGRYNFLDLCPADLLFALRIKERSFPFVESYTVSADSPERCAEFLTSGLPAVQASLDKIPFPAGRYDVVLGLDVLQKAAHPQTLIYEMMRAARGRIFLTTDNPRSIVSGLKSVSLKRIKAFLNHPEFRIVKLEITPVVFMAGQLPLKLSRWAERFPVLKWQCSRLCIYVEYEGFARS